MKYSNDLSVIEWLKPTVNTHTSTPVLKVGDAVPNIFATYTALLPAVGIIQGFPFGEINLEDPSIAQLNKNAAIWEQYGTHSIHRKPNYTPITFKHLAAQFGIPYDLSMVRRLEWSKRGFATLSELTMSSLVALLERLTVDNQLFLYIEDYWRWEAVYQLLPSADEVVYCVSIKEFIAFMEQSFFDATLYLFPSDLSWCLFNLEDRLCPVIGTSKKLGATILESPSLETLQLTWESEL
ncbi:hypothetical protein MTX78_12805 [Hymenobacter tibetensis]|uniref:Uncharacterized protein n=1 Tax=Hymenobacter tibetensis TaxID=497967 RepID=A0ABY4CUZ6_9BACT|nr:hypothetical protein [Hymenobacter tibetensis]UOG73005.1 hypothetical protein MTX78_12805 [Hymenobacter tibetensis]